MLTDEQVNEIQSGWGNQAVDVLCSDHRALTAALKNSRSEVNKVYAERDALLEQVKELTAEQEKAWVALGKIGEYLEHSVTADDWELDPDVKNWIAECLEAKRDIEDGDRRSLDLFDA